MAQTPVGAARTIVTVIPERRGDSHFLYLFLGFAFLAGCLRGLWNGEVVAVVLLPIPVAIFGFWIYMRMKPAFALTIGPDEIVWGRPGDERREVIARDATGWVRIEQTGADGWFLIARDGDEEGEKLSLFGFNLLAVAEACEAHGWPVSMMGRSDFAAARQVAARPRLRPVPAGKAMSKAQRILVGTFIVVSFLVGLGALGVPNWYVAITSLILMFAALGYSEGKW